MTSPRLNGVLKSQFQRSRQNYTHLKDFYKQASILKSRFLKEYSEDNIDRIIGEVREMDKGKMLLNRTSREEDDTSKSV